MHAFMKLDLDVYKIVIITAIIAITGNDNNNNKNINIITFQLNENLLIMTSMVKLVF